MFFWVFISLCHKLVHRWGEHITAINSCFYVYTEESENYLNIKDNNKTFQTKDADYLNFKYYNLLDKNTNIFVCNKDCTLTTDWKKDLLKLTVKVKL